MNKILVVVVGFFNLEAGIGCAVSLAPKHEPFVGMTC